jgi:hypothetical protein
LKNKVFLAKVLKVSDGDTVKAALWLDNKLRKFVFRVGGLDTPEVHSG